MPRKYLKLEGCLIAVDNVAFLRWFENETLEIHLTDKSFRVACDRRTYDEIAEFCAEGATLWEVNPLWNETNSTSH